MGRLEQAGIAVVGFLILIIVGVGFATRQRGDEADPEKEQVALEEQESLRADPDTDEDEGRDASSLTRRGGNGESVIQPGGEEEEDGGSDGAGNDGAGSGGTSISLEEEGDDENSANSGGALANNDNSSSTDDETSDPKGEGESGDDTSSEAAAKRPQPKGTFPRDLKVKSRDTLSEISEEAYGTVRMVAAIKKANPALNNRGLRAGETIELPAFDESVLKSKGASAVASRGTERSTPVSVPSAGRRPNFASFISADYLRANTGAASNMTTTSGVRSEEADSADGFRYYRVRGGDTLSDIAKRELGSVRHTAELLRLNSAVVRNPDQLTVGWRLKLPRVNN